MASIPAMANTQKRLITCPSCHAQLIVNDDKTKPSFKCTMSGTTSLKPPPPRPGESNISKDSAIAGGVCVFISIGLVMSMQTVSLMSGSGTVWTGVAIVGGGAAAAFFLRARLWVRVVAVIVLALALLNAFYIEHQCPRSAAN